MTVEFMLVAAWVQEELELWVLKSCNTRHWNNPGALLAIYYIENLSSCQKVEPSFSSSIITVLQFSQIGLASRWGNVNV